MIPNEGGKETFESEWIIKGKIITHSKIKHKERIIFYINYVKSE